MAENHVSIEGDTGCVKGLFALHKTSLFLALLRSVNSTVILSQYIYIYVYIFILAFWHSNHTHCLLFAPRIFRLFCYHLRSYLQTRHLVWDL